MIVGIHQPNFFPWLGFFDKLARSDLFVLLDVVQYTKGGFQNRVQIKGQQGPQWLTVPVITKGHMAQLTRDVEINHSVRWWHDHRNTFDTLYRKTPYYRDIIEGLCAVYENKMRKLVDFNVAGITWVRRKLGIETPVVLASEIAVNASGSKLLCELVKVVGGTVYLSGPSGRDYLDESVFVEAGLRVEYHAFTPFVYSQRSAPFVAGLSVIDYLFNVGPVFWG